MIEGSDLDVNIDDNDDVLDADGPGEAQDPLDRAIEQRLLVRCSV